MSETIPRATGAPVYPIALATAPRAARALFKRLSSLPTWLAEGWAHPSDAFLAGEAEYSDKRPIQRARKALVGLGVVEYRKVRRGELLPDGKRAAFSHWIYVAGPALRPAGGGESAPAPTEHQNGSETVPRALRVGANLAHRSVDPDGVKIKVELSPMPASEAQPAPTDTAPDRTVFNFGERKPEEERTLPAIAPTVLAHRVVSYWLHATGRRWPTIRNNVLEYVAPFIDGISGDADERVAIACRVVDDAIRENTKPTPASLGYVFHREIWWKRVAAVRSGQPKTFARAPSRPVEAPTPPKRAPAPPKPPSAPDAPTERVDPETIRRFLDTLDAAPAPTSADPSMVAKPAATPMPASSPASPEPPPARDLGTLSRSVGRWVEPPACHDPSCGECERCEKRAPLSRKIFRDLREAARGKAGVQAFNDEVTELRDRDYAARRADQLRRLMDDAPADELEAPRRRLPLASTDEREELRLALEEFHALSPPASSERAA